MLDIIELAIMEKLQQKPDAKLANGVLPTDDK